MLADFTEGRLGEPDNSREAIADLVAGRGATRVDNTGWKSIDTAEKQAGKDAGRRRVKIVSIPELESVAAG